ncbi:MAG: type II secretion system protein [Candidatus Hydrogenedentes bacterium]|nr:type II secretion system protein [Candidatus Hydrogenedentota bacterium]
MRQLGKSRGFTLTELLVATAIFSIMMTAIVTLFVASLHAVKSAYLAADAYETSRGAFNVVERDLSTVFTMRDYGDYYQFFGTPQGMVMVGLIRRADGSTSLGRITYAIFPVVVKDNTDVFRITDPFTAPQLNTNAVNIQVYNDNGTPADPTDDLMEDVKVGTAALVRYIEPGVEDLDTYPFDWNELFVDPENGTDIKAELDAVIGDDSADPDVLVRLDSRLQELLAAKKRELWIRMISGQEYWIPRLTTGAPEELPDVWGDPANPATSPGWLAKDSSGNYVPLNVRDYVVAENIGLETPLFGAGPNVVPLHPLNSTATQNFFRYGHGNVLLANGNWEYPTWNSDELAVAGSPLRPRLPEVVTLRLPFAYERPYPTAPQFERNLEQVIDVPTAYTRTALVAAP